MKKAVDRTDIVGLDAPKVRRADAITLMVHHLALASMYFEAIPDDLSGAYDEIRDLGAFEDDPRRKAAYVWLKVIHEAYEAMAKSMEPEEERWPSDDVPG